MAAQLTKVTSSHWGAFEVTTEGGRIVGVSKFKEDPDPSGISSALPEAVHHRTRVARPSIRRGWLEGGSDRARQNRGNDTFVELPWDEALDIASVEIDRVQKTHGNSSIFGGSYGWASAGCFHHAPSQLHRFLNAFGGFVSSFGSYSTAAAQAIIPHVFGMNFLKLMYAAQNMWPMIAANTQTLVMFGGINPKNSQVSMGGVTRHETSNWFKTFEGSGMRLLNISPQASDAPQPSEWLPIIPGTDTALMLGLAHTLALEELLDREFLDRCTTGYERFEGYLLGKADGQAKTAAWAAGICGVPATTIQDLARQMAASRTLITVAWSLQRAQHGEQPYWMAATLAAMLGQIGLPGGGVGYGYGAIGGIGVPLKRLPRPSLSRGHNAVSDFIPVARIADMLLNPGQPYSFNGNQSSYPDIRLVYWCGGNPFHHHQDLNRLREAWKQPETVIVHEPWWTATAKHSDIVFPATTPYEREDIARSATDSFLFHMPELIPPLNDARDDYQIFSELAARLHIEEVFTEGRDADAWLRNLYQGFKRDSADQGVDLPDYDSLRASNWVELPINGAEHAHIPFEYFRADPDTAPLDTPSGRIEIFSETVDSFGYDDCPGHPVWRAPDEWLGAASVEQFPLHLVSPQPGDKLHSQLECAIADRPGARPATATISAADAQQRGVETGEVIRIFNDRGACLARAYVSTDILQGVVSLSTGAWHDPRSDGTDRQGNPNVLTRDLGTSRLGQGSTAHTTLVEFSRIADD